MKVVAALAFALGLTAAAWAHAGDWQQGSSPAEQALDGAAFTGVTQTLTDHLTDVQSAVVVLRGRVVYEFYRDGAPNQLRDQQSVSKSALSMLTGIALGQGRIASLDQPVIALVPEWAALNADPRAATITVRHLLTMTAGFEVNDPTGTASAGRPRDAWARRMVAAPGEKFAYDNALIPMLSAVIAAATGTPLPEYAQREFVEPLDMQAPSYQRGFAMRTLDMAKLGHLALQKGMWNGKQLVPEAYVTAATVPQNAGGAPVQMQYGYMWWITPAEAPRRTFMASGYSGQVIWVHPPMEAVIAITSTVSEPVQRRGQAIQLMQAQLYPALQRRLASEPR